MESIITMFFIIAFILSVVGAFDPRITWYLKEGWKLKDVTPTKMALNVYRISSIVTAIALPLTYFYFFNRGSF